MNKQYEMVKEFHRSFGTPYETVPKLMDAVRAKQRCAFMLEELDEFLESTECGDIYGQADAMIDLIYFALGTMVEMGIPPDELFDAVHRANMNKLWDGEVRVRETDRKIIKPPDWVPPDARIREIIDSMGK